MPLYKDTNTRPGRLAIEALSILNNGATTADAFTIEGIVNTLWSGSSASNLVLGSTSVSSITVSGSDLLIPWDGSTDKGIEETITYFLGQLQGVSSALSITDLGTFRRDYAGYIIEWQQTTTASLNQETPEISNFENFNVFVMDAITTGVDGQYTLFKNSFNRDLTDPVIVSEVVGSMNYVDVTGFDPDSTATFNNVTFGSWTAGILNRNNDSTKSIRFYKATTSRDGAIYNPNYSHLFVYGLGDTVGEQMQSWVNAINATTPVGVTAHLLYTNGAISGIRFVPKKGIVLNYTTRTVSGITMANFTDTTALVPTVETLADDSFRSGDYNRVLFEDLVTVLPTRPADQKTIYFSRGSILTLYDKFTFEIGYGFTAWQADKDVTLNVLDGATMLYTKTQKDGVLGRAVTSGGTRFGTYSPGNPTVFNIENGAAITMTDVFDDGGQSSRRLTFMIGYVAALGAAIPSFIVNIDNAGVSYYGVGSGNNYYYLMPGRKVSNTVTIDHKAGSVFFIYSENARDFTGTRIIWDSGLLLFNGEATVTAAGAITQAYNAFWVGGNYNFLGAKSQGVLGGYQPRNILALMYNVSQEGEPYFGNWQWTQRNPSSGFGSGRMCMGILWNPLWSFQGAGLVDAQESYYYGQSVNPLLVDSNLVAIKEGVEVGQIGTLGTNGHPFKDTFIGSAGLQTVRTLNYSSYESNNTGTVEGWGDTIDDYNGLVLLWMKEEWADNNNPTSADVLATPYDSSRKWFCYTRRNGFRPYFTDKDFTDQFSTLSPIVLMDSSLDAHWQASSQATIDAIVSGFDNRTSFPTYNEVGGSRVLAFTLLSTDTTWNHIYRWIEYNENNGTNIDGAKIGDENRPVNPRNNNTIGRFNRFIDWNTPVDTEGKMNFYFSDLHIDVVDDISKSPELGSVSGINAQDNDIQLVANTKDVLLSVDISTTGGLSVSGTNSISFEDSDINVVDALVLSGSLTSCTVTALNGFTNTGGINDCVLNIEGDVIIVGSVTNTIINVNGSVTITGVCTNVAINSLSTEQSPTNIELASNASAQYNTEVVVTGSVVVSINHPTQESIFGTLANRLKTVNFAIEANSLNNIVYATSNVDIPSVFTGGLVDTVGSLYAPDNPTSAFTCSGANLKSFYMCINNASNCTLETYDSTCKILGSSDSNTVLSASNFNVTESGSLPVSSNNDTVVAKRVFLNCTPTGGSFTLTSSNQSFDCGGLTNTTIGVTDLSFGMSINANYTFGNTDGISGSTINVPNGTIQARNVANSSVTCKTISVGQISGGSMVGTTVTSSGNIILGANIQTTGDITAVNIIGATASSTGGTITAVTLQSGASITAPNLSVTATGDCITGGTTQTNISTSTSIAGNITGGVHSFSTSTAISGDVSGGTFTLSGTISVNNISGATAGIAASSVLTVNTITSGTFTGADIDSSQILMSNAIVTGTFNTLTFTSYPVSLSDNTGSFTDVKMEWTNVDDGNKRINFGNTSLGAITVTKGPTSPSVSYFNQSINLAITTTGAVNEANINRVETPFTISIIPPANGRLEIAYEDNPGDTTNYKSTVTVTDKFGAVIEAPLCNVTAVIVPPVLDAVAPMIFTAVISPVV